MDDPPDPQFYVGCAQVFVQGSGSATPESVRIGEGTYDLSIPGMTFNIYETPMKLPYPMFRPPVYQSSSGSTGEQLDTCGGDSLEKAEPIVQTIGLKPEGCILVRDN